MKSTECKMVLIIQFRATNRQQNKSEKGNQINNGI